MSLSVTPVMATVPFNRLLPEHSFLRLIWAQFTTPRDTPMVDGVISVSPEIPILA